MVETYILVAFDLQVWCGLETVGIGSNFGTPLSKFSANKFGPLANRNALKCFDFFLEGGGQGDP